jgi:hypothetical protein
VGVAVEDRERNGVAADGLGRFWREGLLSVWLFFRDRVPVNRFAEAALRGRRVGEESLEAKGDGPMELLAEDCFDALEDVAEGSGVLERRLSVMLWAARPTTEGPSETADDLSMMTMACGSGGVNAERAYHRDGP